MRTIEQIEKEIAETEKLLDLLKAELEKAKGKVEGMEERILRVVTRSWKTLEQVKKEVGGSEEEFIKTMIKLGRDQKINLQRFER